MRFVRKLRQREPEQFDRLEFLPGEEMQVRAKSVLGGLHHEYALVQELASA
jgi:hypothetical protein